MQYLTAISGGSGGEGEQLLLLDADLMLKWL
jgi:hypothetical protein